MMKKQTFIPIPFSMSIAFAVLLVFISPAYAQSIKLHFPHFAGQRFVWKIFQGEKELTVRSGEVAPDGRVTLVMPEDYKDYQGMTRWMLKKGGGLDMIYVGSGFSVECLSEHPGPDNIIYTDNPENDFLSKQHRRQQIILDKLGPVNHLLQVYPPDEDFYKIALGEQKSLRLQFEQVQAERTRSRFYAARFGEIVDFTRGIADKVYENQSDHVRYCNDFVTHTLLFMELYTSGHWDRVLEQWVMMNIRSQDTDDVFKIRFNTVLKRITPNNVLIDFVEKTVPLLVRNGKDDIIPVISRHLKDHPDVLAELSKTVMHMILSIKTMTGKQGPDLIWQTPVLTQTGQVMKNITLETDKLDADYTILLFYQGECQLCEDALIVLANKYKWLTDHHVKVIAISGDISKEGFEKKLAYHQWPDNYCDFAGIDGVNFTNYGVLGVPTLFLLNRDGTVLTKSAIADEIIDQVY